ncbi:MAG: preprotein translocase subunit SecG [Deltaproteobacteria bacterium]|nr:preprotein translocase subunit SecG [Deltaproteobacteria bacterium]
MVPLLVVVHVIVCIILIIIVLLQGGKGAEMGAAFGGASQTVFGSAGPTDFLGKLTAWAAAIFMVTSLSLAYFSSGKVAPSVVDKVPIRTEQRVPKLPVLPGGLNQSLPPVSKGSNPASAPPASTPPAPAKSVPTGK